MLATSSSFFGIEIFERGFDLIETSKQLDGFLGDPALVIGPEIEEFAPGVRQATGLGHAFGKERFIARVIVTHESAAPPKLGALIVKPKKLTSVLARAAIGKVKDNGRDRIVGCGAIAPQISTVRFALARAEHRDWGLINVQHLTAQECGLHGLDQRHQGHAHATHPLGRRGAGDRKARAGKDALVQREAIELLEFFVG